MTRAAASETGGRARGAYMQVFASRRIAAMLVLGFASGLPLALTAGALQAWLTIEGIDRPSLPGA